MDKLLFFYFGGITVFAALVAIASPYLIYSALALLVSFVHIAGLYILLHAEFIAAVQIIVYAGAILVLYLFVLMLFNPKQEAISFHRQRYVGFFLGFVLLGLMLFAAFRSDVLESKGPWLSSLDHTQAIGRALYTDFVFPFELASFILLVAMLGAILLSGRQIQRRRDDSA